MGSAVIAQFAGARATNAFGFASFVILLYDHLLTFDDELKYMWKGRISLVSILFLLNRYVTPLGFVINITAYTSTLWTPDICKRFVRFEGAMGFLSLAITFIMMAIRLIAIYRGHFAVLGIMTSLFVIMLAVNIWLIRSGEPVPHKSGITGCTMVFGPSTKDWGALCAWLPLAYDTIVIFLVIFRTRNMVRAKIWGKDRLVTTLISDGIIYYSVILAANLVLGIMISVAPVEIRNIGGQFQVLITVTMMSRITLNVRKRMEILEDEANMFDSFREQFPTNLADKLIYGTLLPKKHSILSNIEAGLQSYPMTATSTPRPSRETSS